MPKHSLPSICYCVAYYVLPHYAFNDCDKLIRKFIDDAPKAGPFLYLIGCQMLKAEPIRDDALKLQAHHGQLDGTHDYFVLEYPTPPPVDLSAAEVVLAPHFSAILRARQQGGVAYYTLGQAPLGSGTTLRSVTADGKNCNLGPGPGPQLDAFLAALQNDR
ncbi:MAG TPA: hypothetical protein VFZ59_09810 [Verrucomicrobiae bacterium]|nr:hypothetical protein [Verrucomicrobiae bacterium]